jgi:hypothetical protein
VLTSVIVILQVEMIFSYEEESIKYCRNYAMDFEVSEITLKNGDDGKRYFTLGCSHARSYVRLTLILMSPSWLTLILF